MSKSVIILFAIVPLPDPGAPIISARKTFDAIFTQLLHKKDPRTTKTTSGCRRIYKIFKLDLSWVFWVDVA